MIFEHIISAIAPHNCLGCSAEGSLLCAGCSQQLIPATPICYRCHKSSLDGRTCAPCQKLTPLSAVHVRTLYEGVAKSLLWKLKFDRARDAARPIATACMQLLDVPADTIITHVPTAPIRVRQRGYDQAERIARYVAKHSGLARSTLLRRSTTARQVGADAQTRRSQLHGAFRVVRSRPVANNRILLVDDVITTGSSLESAAQALAAAGAGHIEAIVFAMAEVPQNNDLVSVGKAGIITSVR